MKSGWRLPPSFSKAICVRSIAREVIPGQHAGRDDSWKIAWWIWKTNECIFWKLAYFYVLLYQKPCLWPHKKNNLIELNHDFQRRVTCGGNQTEPALKLSTYPAMTVARPRRKNHRRLHGWERMKSVMETPKRTTIDNKSWECRKKWVWNGLNKQN